MSTVARRLTVQIIPLLDVPYVNRPDRRMAGNPESLAMRQREAFARLDLYRLSGIFKRNPAGADDDGVKLDPVVPVELHGKFPACVETARDIATQPEQRERTSESGSIVPF